AYLISAQYFYRTGWAVRGEDRPNEVPLEAMSLFVEDLAAAAYDAHQSITLNPYIPWSYLLLLHTVSDGNSPLVETVFQQAIRAFPTYYQPYRQRLYMLTPKWGGSVPAMYAFVDRYAGRAPAGSPLKLLYLQLYVHLADAAAFDCDSLSDSDQDSCMRKEMSRTVSPKMGDDLVQSLRLYKASDPIAYSNALWPILGALAALPRSND